eukprot:5404860-Alexandrium_andersonii.AAC.1
MAPKARSQVATPKKGSSQRGVGSPASSSAAAASPTTGASFAGGGGINAAHDSMVKSAHSKVLDSPIFQNLQTKDRAAD